LHGYSAKVNFEGKNYKHALSCVNGALELYPKDNGIRILKSNIIGEMK